MKEVDLDIIYLTSHTGYLTVCDNEENNPNGKVFASTSKQKTTNACVKENIYIFYDNEYNVFSRFDNLKQEHENSIKIIENKAGFYHCWTSRLSTIYKHWWKEYRRMW